MRNEYAHIPQGGPHIVVDYVERKRQFLAVAVRRDGHRITVLTLALGDTSASAVAACRDSLGAMSAMECDDVE